MKPRGTPFVTNRSKGDSTGILPSDRDMWETVDEMDGTVSAQRFIVSQLSYFARTEWGKLAVSLSDDERHALVHAWSTVSALNRSLAGGVYAATWSAVEERARAALASLQMRGLLVVREDATRDRYHDDENRITYKRTSAAKMVAALIEAASVAAFMASR